MAASEDEVALRTGEVRAADLLETHLARALGALARERATGVLDVDASGLCTTFYLREGEIVFAESGTVGETLGRVLIQRGVIGEDQYRQILRRMTDALVHDELMRFGEVAIELGILSPVQVSEGLAAQMRARVVRCLQLEAARWIFRDDREAVAAVARFSCPLEEAVLDALSEPQEAARWIWRLHARGDLAIALRESVAEIGARLRLGPAELRIARALGSGEPLARLLPSDATDLEMRAALIASLLLLELAELGPVAPIAAPPAAAPRPPAPSPAPFRAPSPAPRPAAPLPAEERAPDRPADAAARRRDQLTGRRASASSTTRRAGARTRLSAEEHYAEGRRYLREGKPAMALRALRAAAEAMPDAPEYRLADALADWLCADDEVLRAASAEVLAHWVTVTLVADRRNAFAHYVQGRLFFATSDFAAALKAFTFACKLDPGDVELTRWQRAARGRAIGR